MLKPRVRRALVAGTLLALAVPSLAACRSSPAVAAYVGDAQITVDELETAVDQRLADDAVAEFAAADPAAYTRRVLGFLVEREVYDEVAQRRDVAVDDGAVRARIDQLMGEDDPAAVYRQLAGQGVSRPDVAETIRQQLLREQLATAAGEGDLSEESLRALYPQVREDYGQLEFGYITVPDEATAAAVLAELTAAPAGYPAVAARYPNPSTLPELARRAPGELPPQLRDQLTAAAPGSGFTVVVPGIGPVVGFVTGVVHPTFEELREQVEVTAAEGLARAGAQLADEVRADLDLRVNPRYGVTAEDGRLVPVEGGAVDILTGAADEAGSGSGD